ncbi:hypothetical protein [Thalassotalea profundi]|uniref:DUF2059 domain-containing protein n=1 Tax=Thalassotalea profundi TaxID=2036687 RepID=A0ABQ3IHL1_9GAMM|nr:hypothetical protein [Thalassotalea profundi]GHE84740.1 hypothetical protein GCM10011501_11940 [Thalassotalea profundi]
MNKQVKVLSFFAFLLIFISDSSLANTVSDKDIYRYLTLSGAEKALANIPAQIESMGQLMQVTGKDTEASQKIMNRIISHWQQDEIEKQVFDYVKQNISTEQMKPILIWLNTDLARKVKQAEAQASEPNFNQEIMNYLVELERNPPSATRVTAINQFIETTRVVEHSITLVMSVAEGLTKGLVIDANEKGNMESVSKIKKQLQDMESMLKPALEQQMIMVSYFIYRNINDKDFQKYSEFYQQELGQKEISLMYKAMGAAIVYWADSMSKEMLLK